MTLTRQQKRQIERNARAYMASVDADLVAKLRAEMRKTIPVSTYGGKYSLWVPDFGQRQTEHEGLTPRGSK